MTIGEMDPNFLENWAAAQKEVQYENIVHINCEIESDMDYIMEFIADSCRKQELEGRVVCTSGTLTTSYEYEHDGT